MLQRNVDDGYLVMFVATYYSASVVAVIVLVYIHVHVLVDQVSSVNAVTFHELLLVAQL